ncbi:MAG: Na(+)-translocating NADH-quinone reductase subunit C [Gemmatimonadaceae bacterium]|nr:Na(+)-translocating NADH-quinone reductase subunit C [Gemmatimonadaceae bacterium]
MSALRRDSLGYTVGFAAVVCLVCAIPIAGAAVLLRPTQAENQRVDRLSKVLGVAGLMSSTDKLSRGEILERFKANVTPRVVDLKTGAYVDSVDANSYDQRAASRDPSQSEQAAENDARVLRVPRLGLVYEVKDSGAVKLLIIPIQGYGLWSTMYGYIALEANASTVSGITFYEHGETPGLGGEIENPRWQARWKGRVVFDDSARVVLRVVKAATGPAATDPHRVEGISGSTITSRGVSNTVQFWLGPSGFGPYLDRFRNTPKGSTP